MQISKVELPSIPSKRYFTINEVAQLAGVKPHILRYWEREFALLRQVQRRGNRRYYQHQEVLLVRRIRGLLYDDGFTIQGARQHLEVGGVKILPATAQEVRVELESILNWLDSSLGKD
ncbi:MerR family transcriptional regulator [Neisseriaceae bacterium TC5R-5]|nr:MerR family transcriptional regulator [Neisseriaceae bacterium TC5R-5]